MNALPIMIAVLCVLAIAYRYYSAFLAARVAVLDDTRVTPAHTFNDGHNYDPTNKLVLFGHHFAAISGAGPLIGPVLAAQFGYFPGLLWLLVGVCLAGAVQDFLILTASVRHKGRSLAQIARESIGPVSGAASIVAILFIIVVALAGLGIAVVKALGGEDVKVPQKSVVTLPAEGAITDSKANGEKVTLLLPKTTVLLVKTEIKSATDGSVRIGQKEFPLSLAQTVEVSAADGAKLAAAPPGGKVELTADARLLVPGSPWGIFTIGASIPIALLMGLWMYVLRKNSPRKIAEASILGVVTMLACVQIGSYIPGTALGHMLDLNKNQVITALAIYGFIASILPVWLLLCPRDYLSSYLKIGTIAALILGVLFINPELKAPWYVDWHGNGPNFSGEIFPFLFITVMCGSISGFHALVSSGTTPKMVNKESDMRMIGYGAMLMEGLVAIVALIAAASLAPEDYYAIQIPMEKQPVYEEKLVQTFKLIEGHHDTLSVTEVNVHENLRGRTGGAVTLAVGMSKIFSAVPGFERLMGYWYHFAIMFEALFILTTIDAGTRIGRFLVQEVMGKISPSLGRVDWWPGAIFGTAVIVAGWAGLLYSGDIATIWPMFGIANQLLAVVAMCVATTVMINAGRGKYAWVTLVPLTFIVSTTLTAGYQMVMRFYSAPKPNYMNLVITSIMLVCVVVILIDSLRSWLRGKPPAPSAPAPVAELSAAAK